jgi:hypothetical protein
MSGQCPFSFAGAALINYSPPPGLPVGAKRVNAQIPLRPGRFFLTFPLPLQRANYG